MVGFNTKTHKRLKWLKKEIAKSKHRKEIEINFIKKFKVREKTFITYLYI